MEARGFRELANEHDHWWWNSTVAELDVPTTKTIKSNVSCKNALEFLKFNGLNIVAVENEGG